MDKVDVPIHYFCKHVGRIGWLTSRKHNLPTMYWRLRKLNTAWLWDFSHWKNLWYSYLIIFRLLLFWFPPESFLKAGVKLFFFVSAKIDLKEHHRSNLPSSVIELYAKTQKLTFSDGPVAEVAIGHRCQFDASFGTWRCVQCPTKRGLQVARLPPMTPTYPFTRALWLNPLVWVERSNFYQGVSSNFGKWIISHM